jgi:hypothetical protein
VGQASVSTRSRAFYARQGGTASDILTILHLPYTAWHLSYVVIGAALAPHLDWIRFGGLLVAFFGGTGLAAHALDEWNGRPLRTQVSDSTLFVMTFIGFVLALGAVIVGVWLFSPWVIAWAIVGSFLATGYALEWFGGLLHTDLGFAATWGAFPLIVGYWVQADSMSVPVILVAVAALIFSLVQRTLSTSARYVRRSTTRAGAEFDLEAGPVHWDGDQLLNSWERPLRLMSAAVVILALGLLWLRV